MKWVTSHDGQLQIDQPADAGHDLPGCSIDAYGWPHLDAGHVHELLTREGRPMTIATRLAKDLQGEGACVWITMETPPYPVALAALGVDLSRFYLVKPKNHADLLWAATESMRCRGVGVTIAIPDRLTTVEARRLQLAAEAGGGAGILLRQANASPHSARTRWLIGPAHGEEMIQRWRMRMVHGRGRPPEHDTIVELHRETHEITSRFDIAAAARTAET